MNSSRYLLQLIIPWKANLLLFGGVFTILLVLGASGIYSSNHAEIGVVELFAWFLLVFFGGVYGIIQIGKIACTYTALVVIADKKITIETSNGMMKDILYGDMISYRYQAFNGGYELRIKWLSSAILKLNSGGQLTSSKDAVAFIEMAKAFESAVTRYQQLQGKLAQVLRGKTFFEKPIATFFLLIYATLIIAAIGIMLLKHKFIPSSLGSFGLFFSFAAAWYAARRRQRED